MKIVCDACSAKYSIADEKVQGKVFKIRCKKCSNIIVVRGTGGAEEAAPAAAAAAAPSGGFDQKETRVYDYGGYEGGGAPADEPAWHIVVDQEQVGPLTVADVQARFAAGEIDSESYIWREGFADWQPLAQVPEFANLVASGSTTTAQPSSGADAVASMFGASNYEEPSAPATGKGDPGDVFAAHAAKQEDEAGGDLFGQKAAAKPRTARKTGAPAADADAPLFGASEPKPAAQPAQVSSMKGQRNENSVLFSLGNLAALASDQPRPAAPSSSSSSGAAAHGGGEGSGLIDIRSMASAYLGGAKPGASSSGPKVGSADDLPVFSTAAFAEPAVIIPTMGGAKNNNKMIYALLGAVALLAIVAVVLVVVVMGKDDKPATAANESDKDKVGVNDKGGADKGGDDKGSAAEPPAGGDKGSAAEPAAGSDKGSATEPPVGGDKGSAVEPPTKPDPGASARPVDPPTRPDSGTKPSSGSSRGSSKPSSGSSKPSSGSSASTKPPADPPSSGGSCMGEVECMLAPKPPACCAKYSGGRKPSGSNSSSSSSSSSSGGDLADSLTKADISAGVAKIQSKASACGAKSSAKGQVKVSVKVAANGTVASVSVKESPDPALGSCVAAAMQKATFAKTKSGGSFSYPFRF